MSENLIIGGLTMVLCVVIQCVVVGILLRSLLSLEKGKGFHPTVRRSALLLVGVTLVMLAGNFLQMILWATLFYGCGEFASFSTAFYHSVVNFSTLGYGDLVMSDERRLLGALEASNGVLMLGLTTSVLFAVLSALMRRAVERKAGGRGR